MIENLNESKHTISYIGYVKNNQGNIIDYITQLEYRNEMEVFTAGYQYVTPFKSFIKDKTKKWVPYNFIKTRGFRLLDRITLEKGTITLNVGELLKEENILIPRNLENRREEYLKHVRKLLQQKHVAGGIDLSDVPEIDSLGNVEIIDGDLILNDTITSLGNLKEVKGRLDMSYNKKVKTLGNLERVHGYLWLNDNIKTIDSMGKLKCAGNISSSLMAALRACPNNPDASDLQIENVLIPRRLEGRRELYIKKLKAMLQQKHIEGDLDLRDFPEEIEDLGNVETISGYLDLYKNQSITSLGNLTSVGGDLDLDKSKVSSLGKLQKVGESIYIDDGQFSEELLDKYKKLFPGKIRILKNGNWEILK